MKNYSDSIFTSIILQQALFCYVWVMTITRVSLFNSDRNEPRFIFKISNLSYVCCSNFEFGYQIGVAVVIFKLFIIIEKKALYSFLCFFTRQLRCLNNYIIIL